MTLTPQELSITYGGFTISDSEKSSYTLNEQSYTASYERLLGTITFLAVVHGDDEAEVNSRCVALEDAFRKRRQSLTISFRGDVYRAFVRTGTTYKNSSATAECLDDELHTGKTRRYLVSIEVDLPDPENDGRTEIFNGMEYLPNRRRRVTVTAQYNATESASASSNFSSDFDSYCDSVLSAWASGFDWFIESENNDSPDRLLDIELTATRVYLQKTTKSEITYGSYSVGGSSSTKNLVNGWSISSDRTSASIGFTVRLTATSASELATLSLELEDEFRKRRQTLELSYDGVVHRTFPNAVVSVDSHGATTSVDNDWFGNYESGGTFYKDYDVMISVDLPPQDEPLGRTEEAVALSEDGSGRATVSISAVYHAIPGSGAKALMDADFDTYADTVRVHFGITTWEQISTPDVSTIPIIDNMIRKSAVYREILFPDTADADDDPDIVNFTFSYDTSEETLETFAKQVGIKIPDFKYILDKTEDVSRLTKAVINVSADIKKDAPMSLSQYWEEKIFPHVINTVLGRTGGNSIIASDIQPRYDLTGSKISATLVVYITAKSFQIIDATVKIAEVIPSGKIFVGAHDGNPISAYAIQSDTEILRVVEETVTMVGKYQSFLPTPAPAPKGIRYEPVNQTISVSPSVKGLLNSAYGIESYRVTLITIQRRIDNPKKTVVVR